MEVGGMALRFISGGLLSLLQRFCQLGGGVVHGAPSSGAASSFPGYSYSLSNEWFRAVEPKEGSLGSGAVDSYLHRFYLSWTVVFPHLLAIFKNPLYEFSWKLLSQGIFGPTIGRWLGLRGLPEIVPLLLVTGILLIILIVDLSRLYSLRWSARLGFLFCCLTISGTIICLGLVLSSLKASRLPPGSIARQDAARELIGIFLGEIPNRNRDQSILREE